MDELFVLEYISKTSFKFWQNPFTTGHFTGPIPRVEIRPDLGF